VVTKGLLKTSGSPTTGGDKSPCDNKSTDLSGFDRAFTFDVEKGTLGWNLLENNMRQDPIPPEPVALNEARLLCREAMTLITEEVSPYLPLFSSTLTDSCRHRV
jgi:hypothetical protein